MYLRPRSIFEHFLIEEKVERVAENGRVVTEFQPTGEEIFCVVSSAEPKEVERWRSLNHTISHVLIQRFGRAKVKAGDKLVGGARQFLVQAVDNPAGLSQWYIFYCEERFDL